MGKNREVAGFKVYDYQTPYEDNRIFVSVETLTAALVPKIPEVEVLEAQDTESSRELARNYEKVLFRTAEDNFVKAKLRMAVRHVLMGYRCGIVKVHWNFDKGRLDGNGNARGAPEVQSIRPHKVVIDQESTDPYDIPLIAENLSSTLEELIRRFPLKKDKILKHYGQDQQKINLGRRIKYWEVWFSYYDTKGVKKEAIAWKIENIILGWGPNPNFNYNEGDTNFLDRPVKPYVFLNFLRIGKWVYDDTSLTEQAAPMQDILNKRGHQIVDNADQANAVKVFNTEMIEAKDAEKYVGDPNDNILAKGDVRMAFRREPAPALPRFVVEDKFDARREIDNIFSTHAPLRGEKTTSPTLGQEILSQRADLGRTTSLSEAVEEMGSGVFQLITQLYKVFADEEHMVRYIGDEGRTAFVKFSKDKIEDGIEIRVRAGSLEPEDKLSDRAEAVELAKTGKIIDPLTFAEKWHLPRPLEAAKRSFKYMFLPQLYAKDVLKMGGGAGDEEALKVIQMINAGDNIPAKTDVRPEYIAQYRQFIEGPAFKQLDSEVKRLHIEHIQGTMEETKRGLKGKARSPQKSDNVMSRIVMRLRGEK